MILKHPLAWKDSSFCLIAICLSKVGMTFYQTSSQQAYLYCLYIPLEILFWHIRPTQPLYHFSCVITMKSIAIYSHWIGQSPGKEALGRVAGGIAAARAEVLCARGAASPAQAAQRCRPRFGLSIWARYDLNNFPSKAASRREEEYYLVVKAGHLSPPGFCSEICYSLYLWF